MFSFPPRSNGHGAATDQQPQGEQTWIPLRELPQYLARRGVRSRQGKPLHLSTIYRWCERGVDGVRLASWRFGRVRCTTPEAIDAFVHRLSETPSPDMPTPPVNRTARREADEAQAILSRRGRRP